MLGRFTGTRKTDRANKVIARRSSTVGLFHCLTEDGKWKYSFEKVQESQQPPWLKTLETPEGKSNETLSNLKSEIFEISKSFGKLSIYPEIL